jgi:hypothetical protein
MKARLLAALLLLLGIVVLAQQPQAQLRVLGCSGSGAGKMILFKPCTVASPSYVGPGDVGITTPLAWAGLRAFSAATRGNNAIHVCNPGDITCADMVTDATTGALVVTTVGGSDCSIVVCTVQTIYDQTAGGNCTGSCNLVQTTIANRAALTVSCSGLTSRPCLTLNGTSSVYQAGNFSGQSQPFVYNFIFNHPFTSARQDIAATIGLNLGGTAGNVFCALGGFDQISGSGLDGNWGSLSVLGNGASSDIHVNSAAPNIVDCGTGALTTPFQLGGTSNFLSGSAVEFGVWNSGPSSTTMNTLSANAHTFWGF